MKKPPQSVSTWRVGDRVNKRGMIGPYEITRVGPDDVDLCLIGTNFELFRVPIGLIEPSR